MKHSSLHGCKRNMPTHLSPFISTQQPSGSFRRHGRSSLAYLLTLLMLVTFTSLASSINSAHAAATVSMPQATFTVDNVTVHIQSNALPDIHFQSTRPGDSIQRALVTKNNPYKTVSVTAIPYGTRGEESLPTAQAGIASTYRSQLRTAWKHQTQTPQSAPAINLFGTQIAGTLYHVQMPLDSLTSKPALIAEWVGEAGARIWLVRVLQEGTPSSTNEFLQQFQGTALTSTTLYKKTTLQTHSKAPATATATASPAATSGNLPYPSVWNGTFCDTANHPTAYQLGTASYRGVPACGPRPFYDTDAYSDRQVNYFPGAWGELEFECVELVMRYMYLGYNISPYPANGNQVVTNYSGSTLNKKSSSNNTLDSTMQAGDILSWNTGSSAGHTSLVSTVNLDSNGNGTISAVEQNASSNGTFTYPVNSWVLNTEGYGTLLGWLYDPNGTTTSGGPNPDDNDSSTYVAKNSNGLLEVFARGADNNIWHIWQTSTTSWSGWSTIQSGMTFQGDPTVVANADGRLEVFARGNDNNIWHAWQTTAGSTWSGWIAIQPGYAFQGTPAVAKNSSGKLEVFARGSDNHIWHVWQQGTGWSGWGNLQSSGTYASSPVVTANQNGLLEVFARNSDNNIWHVWQQSTTSWSGWGTIQTGKAFKGTPAVGQNVDGRLELFVRGTDNNMWHIWQTQAGVSWSGWATLTSGATLSGNPAVGVNNDGRLEVYARGSDNNLYHMWQTTAGTTWDGGWVALQPNYGFQGTASAGTDADGRVEVFALGSDNNLWHIWQTTAGTTWSGWIALQPNYGFVQ